MKFYSSQNAFVIALMTDCTNDNATCLDSVTFKLATKNFELMPLTFYEEIVKSEGLLLMLTLNHFSRVEHLAALF